MAVVRWSWLGEPLAVDLANTVRRRGLRYVDLITTPADLATWLSYQRDRVSIPTKVGDDLLEPFLAARDHTLQVLRAAATGQPLPAADVAVINERVLAAPSVRLLGAEPGLHLTRPVSQADPASRLLAELAASVVDLLTGGDAGRLALCDAPGCGQLYLRGRANQQWCNPHCGNRARTQRHADRHTR
jgi:predicted RNA-binding Zn ribbon-like protein